MRVFILNFQSAQTIKMDLQTFLPYKDQPEKQKAFLTFLFDHMKTLFERDDVILECFQKYKRMKYEEEKEESKVNYEDFKVTVKGHAFRSYTNISREHYLAQNDYRELMDEPTNWDCQEIDEQKYGHIKISANELEEKLVSLRPEIDVEHDRATDFSHVTHFYAVRVTY